MSSTLIFDLLRSTDSNPRGTGYIGSFTALALLEADYEVIIVDNLRNSSIETVHRIQLICGKRPDFYNVDITEPGALDKVFEAHPAIDSVIHFAALKVSVERWSSYSPRLRALAESYTGSWRVE